MTDTMVPKTAADFSWLALVDDLPEDHVLVKFYQLRQQGTVWKQMPASIKEKVGYHEGSLFEQRQRAAELGECIDLNGKLQKMSPTQFGQWVRKQRLAYDGAMDLGNKTGLSWAEIMVRAGLGEAPCRKAFTAVANADHKGLRIGHGGRFLEDRADQYQDKAKVHGWIRPRGELSDEILAERLLEITGSGDLSDEFSELTVKELKGQLKELGQPTTGKKNELVLRLVTALAN